MATFFFLHEIKEPERLWLLHKTESMDPTFQTVWGT
ncbi:uncharacterized protein J3R85_019591 [Psidium guajava]|nr:uncharacterized protein J3R85_019591 [Psidium guajava]